jgi:synaptobrevin homolog YKT6
MKHILGIVTVDDKKNEISDSYFDLSDFSFFYKTTAKEFLLFGCIEITKRANKNLISIIDLKDTEYYDRMKYLDLENIRYNVIYDNNTAKWICIITSKLCRKDFLLSMISHIKTTTSKNYDKIIEKYENMLVETGTNGVDKVAQIQHDIDDTKEIMCASIDKLIERGVKLDDLLEKSQTLYDSSKLFVIKTKKLNTCCDIL